MNIYSKISKIMLTAAVCACGIGFTGCSDDDDEYSTDQFAHKGVYLNVFGPSPVARGGELRFIGTNIDKVTAIEIPGCDPITDIKVINSEEIRISVPQTAEPGKVTLKYADGTITTKTMLSYLEPISIDAFSPASVLPGDEITITGEYLNLIHEVIFADDIAVAEDAFTEHSRDKISLYVPEEARSGKLIISDGAPQLPNWIYSEQELIVVLPSVEAPLDLTSAKPGDEVTIKGNHLDLVRTVEMPDGTEVEFTYADSSLKFTLPDNISDGAIVAIPASGVRVAIANIGVVVPTELAATPSADIRPGQMLKISGVNMDMVSTVIFPNVEEAVKPDYVCPTYINIAWPSMAQSGTLTLNLKSGKTVSIDMTTAKPMAEAFNPDPVAAAAEFTITGKNLDLVTKVTFSGDITVEAHSATPASLTLTAPATAQSGPLTLHMANGENVTTPTLTIDAPQCAYITEVITEELLGGELMIANIANSDYLTNVMVNGANVQYIVTGDKLYISLPASAGQGSVVTLISSNGEISYTYDVKPATSVEIIAYNDGPRDLGSWASEAQGGAFRIKTDVFQGIPAGAKLVFHIAPYAYTQIQINDANWGQLDILKPDQSATTAEFELTAEILNHILSTKDGWSDTGMVIQGEGCVVNKVTLKYEISLEQMVKFNCNFPVDLGQYTINLEAGPGTALIDAGVAVGKKLNIYLTPYADYNYDNPAVHLQLFDGHWGKLSFPEIGGDSQFNESNWPDMTKVTITITEDLYQRFITYTDWGYCLIFQGNNVKLEKVTVE